MKKFLFFYILILIISSCKKETDNTTPIKSSIMHIDFEATMDGDSNFVHWTPDGHNRSGDTVLISPQKWEWSGNYSKGTVVKLSIRTLSLDTAKVNTCSSILWLYDGERYEKIVANKTNSG